MRATRMLVVLLGLAGACSDTRPTGPTETIVVMTLATPNADDGALLLRVVGEVTAVRPMGQLKAAWVRQGALTRVVVTGDIAPGALLQLTIPDAARLTFYSAAVEQAASRTDYALRDLAGYSVMLIPQ